MENKIKLFEDRRIRYAWDAEREEWFFSAVDVCYALSESAGKDPGSYWRKLKQRLKNEGSEVVTNCHGLKLVAPDGKMRETDCFSTKDTLSLIQSIPSPKAEPFKMWLAQVGAERVDEIADPEKAILRGTGAADKPQKALGKYRPHKGLQGISVSRASTFPEALSLDRSQNALQGTFAPRAFYGLANKML